MKGSLAKSCLFLSLTDSFFSWFRLVSNLQCLGGKKVTTILSRSSSRGQATPEVKITLIPFSAFTDDKVASKRNMRLTSKFLNINSPLLQVVDDFVGVNMFYQYKKITNKELKRRYKALSAIFFCFSVKKHSLGTRC